MTTTYRRSGGLTALLAVAAIGLAACTGSPSSPQVASLGTSSTTTAGGSSTTIGAGSSTTTTTGGGSSTTEPGSGNATELLNEWTDCMRSHGDPNQADPIVDASGAINIHIPEDVQSLSNDVHGGGGPCATYLSAASDALRAADPVAPPPDYAEQVKYTDCMRANGVSNYPDPNPTTGESDFNGTGVDPNSAFVEKANKVCGKQIGAPAWWISGTGPPGDVVVTSGPGNGPPPGAGGNGAVPVNG